MGSRRISAAVTPMAAPAPSPVSTRPTTSRALLGTKATASTPRSIRPSPATVSDVGKRAPSRSPAGKAIAAATRYATSPLSSKA
ncbi:hypothetical protein SD37_18665 [Amycolatopsis orientalis]|uniref:Uncharacterized protein n=1 Tax=Amycolatopsis orientalis TaxID=31958 RepID=A0A193BZ00_AMYOR|nr:hypothetical protein SD37_18665 [Amycolatopsis orientalis]